MDSTVKKIFLGTRNRGKIDDWRLHFPNLDIVSPFDVVKFITVEEGPDSIFENAKKKALAWSGVTALPTASDDTGFFIPALNGLPGVRVKTFGGELTENRSDKAYVIHLKERMKDVENKTCFTESAVAFAKGGVLLAEDSYKIEGELVLDGLDVETMEFEDGFPIGSIFKPTGAKSVWIELSEEEKAEYDTGLVACVERCLKKLSA